jgi:hypothetical protein
VCVPVDQGAQHAQGKGSQALCEPGHARRLAPVEFCLQAGAQGHSMQSSWAFWRRKLQDRQQATASFAATLYTDRVAS